jgi:hypothetical protein
MRLDRLVLPHPPLDPMRGGQVVQRLFDVCPDDAEPRCQPWDDDAIVDRAVCF